MRACLRPWSSPTRRNTDSWSAVACGALVGLASQFVKPGENGSLDNLDFLEQKSAVRFQHGGSIMLLPLRVVQFSVALDELAFLY